MEFLEKDLEEIIFTTDKETLSEHGLDINGKLYRQLKIGNYGIADLVSFHKQTYKTAKGKIKHNLYIKVFELKKEKIGISAFLQAMGYLKGIDSYLSERFSFLHIEFQIVLIGKNIDKSSSFSYLPDYIQNNQKGAFLTNYTYSLGIEGLVFEEQNGYALSDEGFNLPETESPWF